MIGQDGESAAAQPDYRFLLANERTFLAYIRTALALNGGALAIDQLLDADRPLRIAFAGLGAGLGFFVSATSYRRWRSNDEAIRADQPLATPVAPFVLATGMVVISVLVFVVFIVG